MTLRTPNLTLSTVLPSFFPPFLPSSLPPLLPYLRNYVLTHLLTYSLTERSNNALLATAEELVDRIGSVLRLGSWLAPKPEAQALQPVDVDVDVESSGVGSFQKRSPSREVQIT